MASYLEKCLKERKELTPKKGFNVVTFDDFSPPGEMLTLVGHVETYEEAKKIAKENEGELGPVYIYEAEEQ